MPIGSRTVFFRRKKEDWYALSDKSVVLYSNVEVKCLFCCLWLLCLLHWKAMISGPVAACWRCGWMNAGLSIKLTQHYKVCQANYQRSSERLQDHKHNPPHPTPHHHHHQDVIKISWGCLEKFLMASRDAITMLTRHSLRLRQTWRIHNAIIWRSVISHGAMTWHRGVNLYTKPCLHSEQHVRCTMALKNTCLTHGVHHLSFIQISASGQHRYASRKWHGNVFVFFVFLYSFI